jgi:hypothetical protein
VIRASIETRTARVLSISLACFFGTCFHTTATHYFLRADGDDASAGLSQETAWKSIDRANAAVFHPGDRLLFHAGDSFPGNLSFHATQADGSRAPITIGSFGHGRATILAGRKTGITILNLGGVIVRDLVITGAGRTNNTGYGLLCDNKLGTATRLANLRVENVDAAGFGVFGVLITGNNGGFDHVLVRDCALHDNLRGGMEIAGKLPVDATNYAHAHVDVVRCQAWNNTGDPTYLKNHSGSGIVLYQVDEGLMDECTAWNNSSECHNKAGGGVGLWTCASRRVIIQHCESFANRTSGADGGGFDIDGGCIDCVLQYNYSHDNAGPGLMVYTYPYAAYADRNNIVRFNVSENDSRQSHTYAGLYVHSYGPHMSGLKIYNNTVITGDWTDQAAAVYGASVEGIFCNNIFCSGRSSHPLRVFDPNPNLRFIDNVYAARRPDSQITWGTNTFNALTEWQQATGQELFQVKPVGRFMPVEFSGHSGHFQPFHLGKLTETSAFRPVRTSRRLIPPGISPLALFGAPDAEHDILGRTLDQGRPWPVGAVAWR